MRGTHKTLQLLQLNITFGTAFNDKDMCVGADAGLSRGIIFMSQVNTEPANPGVRPCRVEGTHCVLKHHNDQEDPCKLANSLLVVDNHYARDSTPVRVEMNCRPMFVTL